MPYAIHRRQKIHYTVEGEGPLVVLQHGMLMDGSSWAQGGFVQALSDRYRVACVDSLGHGASDRPGDAALYDQAQRAGDIVAVIDDLGAERAHLIGYSMGGWMSVGVARHHPDRLASLVVGGWDLVDGTPRLPQGRVTFEIFMDFARQLAPELLEWVTPADMPGLRACYEALSQLDGASEAVLGAGVPVLLWNGREDAYHAPMQVFAAAHGLSFLSSAGDHLAAAQTPDAATIPALRAFLDAA
jgi:pimeloyl-ACP methyl ester carboxylesterase